MYDHWFSTSYLKMYLAPSFFNIDIDNLCGPQKHFLKTYLMV
jgi:hypothetical protein